jgi:hypothetical protein
MLTGPATASVLLASTLLAGILTNAHVSTRILMHPHVCSRMLTYAHVCSRILTYAPGNASRVTLLHVHARGCQPSWGMALATALDQLLSFDAAAVPVSSRILTYADVCPHMLTNGDEC